MLSRKESKKEKKEKLDLDNLPAELIASRTAEMKEAIKTRGIETEEDEADLLRFLKARQMDVTRAADMYKAFKEWRKTNKVDEMVFEKGMTNAPIAVRGYEFIPDQNMVVPEGDIELESLKTTSGGHCFHKHSKAGHPIYIERVGLHDLKALTKLVPMERVINVHIMHQELYFNCLMKELSEKFNKPVQTSLVILDLKGLGMHMMHKPALTFFKSMAATDSDNYPERLYRSYIVNAPKVFTSFWSMVKPFLDPRVLSKVRIMGPDYATELLKEIDAENLPSFLGGKCTCSHMEGGCCPTERLDENGKILKRSGSRASSNASLASNDSVKMSKSNMSLPPDTPEDDDDLPVEDLAEGDD